MTLAEHLEGFDDERLSEFLRARPDLLNPEPRSFRFLATRAIDRRSLAMALTRADLGMLLVAQAVCLLGQASVSDLAERFGAPERADEIEAAVERLADWLLVGVDPDTAVVTPVGRLADLFPRPLGHGRPFLGLTDHLTGEEAKVLAANIGASVSGSNTKHAFVVSLAEMLADPMAVRALRDELSDQARALLDALIEQRQPVLDVPWWVPEQALSAANLTSDDPAAELIARGLLMSIGGEEAEVPREVGLALYDGPLMVDPPLVRPLLVDRDGLALELADGAGAAEAAALLVSMEGLLSVLADRPLKLRKSGGVGVREIRSLAKALDTDERTTSRLVELARSARLLDIGDDAARPSDEADRWLSGSRPGRWVVLIDAWLRSDPPISLAMTKDPDGRMIGALETSYAAIDTVSARRSFLDVLAELDAGRAFDPESCWTAVTWRAAGRWGTVAEPETIVEWFADEARMLGLLVENSPTSALRAIARGKGVELREMALAMLPLDARQFVIQSDLSAVALGSLDPAVARDLTRLAERESGSGGAVVYRFTEASLRSGFDDGWSVLDIVAFLDEHALSGVPQPLGYLIEDVARRHGSARVGAAQTYVRSDDAALIADLAGHRRTTRLHFRIIAPTVAISPKAPAEVLTTLRRAGFLPVEENEDGVLSLPMAGRASAPAADVPTDESAPPDGDDVEVLLLGERAEELFDDVDIADILANLRVDAESTESDVDRSSTDELRRRSASSIGQAVQVRFWSDSSLVAVEGDLLGGGDELLVYDRSIDGLVQISIDQVAELVIAGPSDRD